MLKTFRIGGVHPPDNKLSKAAPIIVFPLPENVIVPLSQHLGAPAVAVVAKGDHVLAGQRIAAADGYVSANVHSPVSGTVTGIEAVADVSGILRPCVTIRVEGDEWDPAVDRSRDLAVQCDLSPEQIIQKITDAGIVGMGGATFPTQVKLSIPKGKKAEALIINGVECEPYLTADHRLMLERGDELIIGVKILARALGVKKSYIGIENNKPDAIAHLEALAAGYGDVKIVPLKVNYPQGGERQLIDAVLRRRVPSGALPVDVGAVVQNVATALAVYEAVQKNKPLVERIVTVTGKGLQNPANFLVRIGTPLRALVDYCGGVPASTGKVIAGGPMMGRAAVDLDAPVTKGISGVLLMEGTQAQRPEIATCIKCAKCVAACPMGLEPYLLGQLGRRMMYAEMEPNGITDCIECGCCTFTCPAGLPLLDYVRLGRAEVVKIIKARCL